MNVVQLRCEYLANPVGLDEPQPRLSWRMESDARGARQVAHQIQVASDAALLATGHVDVWDSGTVAGDATVHVVYKGPALEPCQRYWWRVRIWDERGSVSPWSEIAFWETGFLSDRQWDADWISVSERDGKTSEPCPFLRRRFDCPHLPARARLYVTALGLYECHLNGERIGADCFTLGWTEYQVRILRHGDGPDGCDALVMRQEIGYESEGSTISITMGPRREVTPFRNSHADRFMV